MNAAAVERDLFAPQKLPGMRSGLALAIAAHVLLIIALAWSVHWKSSEPEGVVAELWSAVPQTAAPRAVAPPEPKPPEPKPAPPAPVVRPAPPPPTRPDAQIAIERERAAREKARQEELERAEAAKKAAETKKREDAKRLEAEHERQRLADEAAEKKKLAEQAKKDEARQAAIREANLKKMMREAGSSDDPLAAGNSARTAGPSAGYAGRIKARIKPNIVLTAPIDGNPSATVEVKVAPDGTIVGRKLVKGSGSKVWDDTVLRAIDKTEMLPKDVDGRVPPTIEIDFRPRD